MKYQKTVNIYSMTKEQVSALPCGQWVSTSSDVSDSNHIGRFYGVKKSGSIVVAWNGNARRAPEWKAYQKALYNYAKGA
jgi:hypothetical protein